MRALLVVIALAGVARADVWQRAIDGKGAQDTYDSALHAGDERALRANAKGQPKTMVTRLVDEAIDHYRQAAKARPAAAEPYYRIASLLESFFTDCMPIVVNGRLLVAPPPTCPTRGQSLDLARAEATLAAWSEFEKRAPLDPRVAESLFSRAILRTKLVAIAKNPTAMLQGALADYRAILDRTDGLTLTDPDQVWGNLAETYMMLGKMEEAIDAYRTALRLGGDSAVAFGLAVALDRDDSPAEALEVILAQSESSLADFEGKLREGHVFFVPEGEVYYYFALIAEARGNYADAIRGWRQFIQSGAHPAHQPRAKQHLDALQAKVKSQPHLLQRPRLNPWD